MFPAITLTLSAQCAKFSSALVGQQLRLYQAALDQGLVAQKAMLTPFWMINAPKTAVPQKAVANMPATADRVTPAPKPKLVEQTTAEVTPPKAEKPAPKAAAPKAPKKRAAAKPASKRRARVTPKATTPSAPAKPTPAPPPQAAADKGAEAKSSTQAAPPANTPVAADSTTQAPPSTPKAADAPAKTATAPEAKPVRAKSVSIAEAPWDGQKTKEKT